MLSHYVRGPFKINKLLKQQRLTELKAKSISNYVYTLKRELFEPVKTYANFTEWCTTYHTDDNDIDSPRIVSYEAVADAGSNNCLRVVMSTRRLLQSAVDMECVCADATYKLNIHGFPVIIVCRLNSYSGSYSEKATQS